MNTTTPLVHAGVAALYIMGVVSGISTLHGVPEENLGILIPIAMFSLLVLSVALMAYLFFYEPLRLLLEGRAREGLLFFGKTLGIFAGFVAVALATLFAFSYF